MIDDFPDFHGLRLRMTNYPDEMIHDLALEVLRRAREGSGLSDADLLWLIESYERRRPRVVNVLLDETTAIRERLG